MKKIVVAHFLNKECKIHAEYDMFFSKIIGYLHPTNYPDL
jgi:hypothetical protein